MPTVDPREAFGAFAHPVQPWDRLPDKLSIELDVTDSRKVGSWPGADVYIVFSAPSTLCLVIDSNPPWGNAGGSVCSNAGEYADTGTATLWSGDDPENDSQATVLIPDSATATIERGTFIAAGNGVIGIKPTNHRDGVAVTLTFPNGHKSHFDLKPR